MLTVWGVNALHMCMCVQMNMNACATHATLHSRSHHQIWVANQNTGWTIPEIVHHVSDTLFGRRNHKHENTSYDGGSYAITALTVFLAMSTTTSSSRTRNTHNQLTIAHASIIPSNKTTATNSIANIITNTTCVLEHTGTCTARVRAHARTRRINLCACMVWYMWL